MTHQLFLACFLEKPEYASQLMRLTPDLSENDYHALKAYMENKYPGSFITDGPCLVPEILFGKSFTLYQVKNGDKDWAIYVDNATV